MKTNRTNKDTKIAKGTCGGGRAGGSRRRGKSLNPFAERLSAHVTEEGEWVTGPPNLTLSRMFLVVLLLHIVIVGGILAFEMFKDDPVGPAPLASVKPISSGRDGLSTNVGSRVATGDGAGTYRVRAGDTLLQIAKLHNVSGAELTAINRLGGGDQIYPGQVLLIPENGAVIRRGEAAIPALPGSLDGGGAEIVPAALAGRIVPERGAAAAGGDGMESPDAPNVISVPPTASGRTHKVEEGETAFAISKRYGVKVDALLTANGITDARQLRAGKVIEIP